LGKINNGVPLLPGGRGSGGTNNYITNLKREGYMKKQRQQVTKVKKQSEGSMKYDLDTAITTIKALGPISNDAVGKILESLGICSRSHTHNIIRNHPEVRDEIRDIEARHAQESAKSGFLGHEIRTSTLRQVKEKQETAQEQEKPLLLTEFEENQVDKSIDNLRKTIAQSKEQPPPTQATPRVQQFFQFCVNNMLAPEAKKKKEE